MKPTPWRSSDLLPSAFPRWMDRWFDEDFIPEITMRDGLDVYETDDEVVVKAAVPGVADEDVNVTFEDGVLRIQAQSEESEDEKQKKKNVYRERRMRAFDYMTTLPRSVDASKIKAEVDHGVVSITAPITAASKPKRIMVRGRRK